MPTFYGVPSDGTVIPEQLETALAADIAAPESPIRGALDAAGLGAPSGPIANSVILFGTSLEFQNGTGATALDPVAIGSPAPMSGRGWYHWTNALVGNRLTMIRNAGISGNTYAQMRARIDADVLAHDSNWVFMGPPMNDVSTGRTFEQITADATAMLDKLAGRRVLFLNHPPHSGLDTAAEQDVLFRVNDWIRSLPTTRDNVLVVDAWRALSGGQTTTPTLGLTTDGVHYSIPGAARVGRLAADALLPWLTAQPYRTSSSIDPRRIIANPALIDGTGWTVLGTGVTAAYSLDDNAPTTKAVLTYSGVTSTGNLGIQAVSNIAGGLWAPGDVVQVSARVRWSGITPIAGASVPFGPVCLLTFRDKNGLASEAQWGLTASAEWTDSTYAPVAGDTIVTTARYTIPESLPGGTTVDRVEVRLGFRGIASGTVTVSDVAAVKGA